MFLALFHRYTIDTNLEMIPTPEIDNLDTNCSLTLLFCIFRWKKYVFLTFSVNLILEASSVFKTK